MFVVDLRDLREGPRRWEEVTERPAEVWPDLAVPFGESVRLRGEARLGPDGDLHVGGRLEVAVRLACRRCLAELDRGLVIPLDLWFRRDAEEMRSGSEAVFPLEPVGGRVELGAALREELLLALPPFPECEEGCGGLCPFCGARRDEETCDCSIEENDPRWDALRSLR